VGLKVGTFEVPSVGYSVGVRVDWKEGHTVGVSVSHQFFSPAGANVGVNVGSRDGTKEGKRVDTRVGESVGTSELGFDGLRVGTLEINAAIPAVSSVSSMRSQNLVRSNATLSVPEAGALAPSLFDGALVGAPVLLKKSDIKPFTNGLLTFVGKKNSTLTEPSRAMLVVKPKRKEATSAIEMFNLSMTTI